MTDVLGEGGFGTVYLAEDRVLRQRVAIKVLHLGMTNDRARQRFIFEAQTAANLRHSGIVNVFDIVQTSDGLQQVMEYYPGGTLKDLVAKEGPLPPKRALGITLKALDALGFAHQKGIIHRDIKPANVFIAEDGSIKIGDFGLCVSSERHEHTLTGETMGTPLYMAPEQMNDAKNVDQRVDIYSLGLTLYHMLTGERPAVVDLSLIPAPLRPLISRATAQDRDRRLQTCDQFRAMIYEVLPLIDEEGASRGSGTPFQPEDIHESASLRAGTMAGSSDSTKSRGSSGIAQTGRNLSIAVGVAMGAVFVTLGIVGGYITLTSRAGGGRPPASEASGVSAESSAAAGEQIEEPIVEAAPVSNASDPAASATGARSGQPLFDPVSTPDGIRRAPRRPGGTTTSGFQRVPRRTPPGGMDELPFFFPEPALRPISEILRNLSHWIEVDQGAEDSQALLTAARRLEGGKTRDRANPVYPYLMARISERIGDAASAKTFYEEARRKSDVFMERPGEMMQKVADLAEVEAASPAAQALLFGDPAPEYR